MGEIDTKPIDSVQTALTFFGHKNDQQKNSPTKDEHQDLYTEREKTENIEKELANAKLQLEAKDSAIKQALLKIDHHQKTSDELSALLKNSDLKKEFYISESREANKRTNELESTIEQMALQLSESENLLKNQLIQTTSDLSTMETELTILREENMESLSQNKVMEEALREGKLEKEELWRQVLELNETVTRLETKVVEVEREKSDALSTKESELELEAKALSESLDQLECLKTQLETMQELENQLLEKTACIDSLQLEIKHAEELLTASERVASDANFELNRLKEDLELQEKRSSDIANELNNLRIELDEVKAEAVLKNEQIEETKTELEKSRERENEAQVEIALLKFELHKGRSKLAVAEAAEIRAQGEKSALYNALQQLGLEAEEIRKKNRILKEASKSANEEVEYSKYDDDGDEVPKNYNERENNGEENTESSVRKELEAAMLRIGELRTRAEQAMTRADVAEKGKVELEGKMKRWREHRERRKAALAALREESVSRDYSGGGADYDDGGESDISTAKNYQPLHKVLNMKF